MNDTETTALLAEMRAEMARRAVTASGLAATVGMSADQMSRRMAGKIALTVPEALAIAAALDCPLSALIARAEQAKAAA